MNRSNGLPNVLRCAPYVAAIVQCALAIPGCGTGDSSQSTQAVVAPPQDDVESGDSADAVDEDVATNADAGVAAFEMDAPHGASPAAGGTPDLITVSDVACLIPGAATFVEPSNVYSLRSSGIGWPATHIVAYNDRNAGGNTTMGWAWTSNTLQGWTHCNAGTVGCGQPDGGVPPAPASGGFAGPQIAWDGDPNVVAVQGGTTRVVYVTLGHDNGATTANMVVASVSIDNGRHFINTVAVNDLNCGGDNTASDQPAATVDSVTGQLWVAWRYNANPGRGGTYGACVRGGTVNSDGSITWLNGGFGVPVVHDAFHGVGGVEIASNSAAGQIAIGYTWSDEYADPDSNCPNQNVRMEYYFQMSSDGGQTWANAEQVLNTASWPTCFNDIQTGNTANRGTFGFAFEPTLHHYFLVAQNTIQNLNVYYRGTGSTPDWTQVTTINTKFPLLYPVLTTSTQGDVGIGFYSEDPTLTKISYQVFASMSAGTTNWQGPMAVSALFAPDPQGGYVRQLGDYESITAMPRLNGNAQFVPAWTDSSAVTPPSAEVFAGLVTVSP